MLYNLLITPFTLSLFLQEDEALTDLVETHGSTPHLSLSLKNSQAFKSCCVLASLRKSGARKWSFIARKMQGRIGKQCRERWFNHLDPLVRKDGWSPEEDAQIYQLHQQFGNQVLFNFK